MFICVIRYWDMQTGKQFLAKDYIHGTDSRWKTFTLPLGFYLMGIWPPYSDGTDINSVDVSKDRELVIIINIYIYNIL